MLEMFVWSLFVGTLGIEAVMASGWLRWRDIAIGEKEREEEETLTDYQGKNNGSRKQVPPLKLKETTLKGLPRSLGNLPEELEYKIVRASSDIFRDSEIFLQLCEEEARAGWRLLEKLDDRRVRFKRPIELRRTIDPESLSFDPYRSHYGSSLEISQLFLGIAAIAAITLPAFLGYALVSSTLANSSPRNLSSPPTIDIAPSDLE
ncbi:MAG: hypothetical protein F6J93_01280 [Oscillatoria sp. SIO1A7]|nr:hypothetical protein [Oscillatoria sp. SIO1A7]